MSKARTLADFISDGSEFADGTISVAEVSGAAPLASPTFTGTASGTFSGPLTGNVTGNVTGDLTGDVTGNVTGNLTGNVTGDVAGDIDLSAIAATISDTAVDIFVYDTRKDSDGGAWRKRTQHTSWYNETLNTATRGSRKEFPAVAVIVAETNQVTIYDGDDPDLPMWMVFNTGGNWNHILVSTSGYVTCVAMLNGHLVIGRNLNTGWQLTKTSFVDDSSYGYKNAAHGTSDGVWTGGIVARNGDGSYYDNGVASNILSPYNNDVAMTVLPNAPIDPATGLPVPTIAVATDGGVSVIKDDGTVVDGVYTGGNSDSHTIALKSDGTIAWTHENGPYFLGKLWEADWSTGTGVNVKPRIDGSMFYPAASGDYLASVGLNTTCTINAAGSSSGLTKVDVPSGSDASVNGMVNFITSDYNTGWMNGDIKLATLSDTDDTNVTGSELVTNGTFDTDTSGWTAYRGANLAATSGNLVVTATGVNYGGSASQGITTVVGQTYTLSFDLISEVDVTNYIAIRDYPDVGGGNTIKSLSIDGAAAGTYSITFTATGTTTYVVVVAQTPNSVVTVDNISVRLAEEDRSVNGNGLQVFGTVTKSAVATGADLVAYSGFNASNYLKQPYNSDLAQVGTGDFCIMLWLKHSDTDAYIFSVHRPGGLSSNRYALEIPSSGNYRFLTQEGSVEYDDVAFSATDVWHQVVALRRSGTKEVWINGDLYGTETSTANISSTDAELVIGKDYASSTGNLYSGSIALARFSATAPSPEQIAKIYEDEKVLFQEGAQATLYGSSDAVTALAYDDSTNLLHVGTSAGRSVFQGLRRVDNTTNAVGTAISASNSMVAED